MTDAELLGQFVRAESRAHAQHAFAGLVRRHVDWVKSAARRMVRDPGLAEDVTQAVFIVLARKAPRLAHDPGRAGGAEAALSAWLFGVTRHVARAAARSRSRRERHEIRAGDMAQLERDVVSELAASEIRPDAATVAALDEMVARLGRRDREAVLLRYYERKSFVQIGAATGISEEAARKRVGRAVDRLRELFARKGVVLPAAAAAALLGGAVEAAPLALAARACEGALAGGVAGSSALALAKGAMTMMTLTKIKTAAAVVGVLCLIGGTGAWISANVLGRGGADGSRGGGVFARADSASASPESLTGAASRAPLAVASQTPPALPAVPEQVAQRGEPAAPAGDAPPAGRADDGAPAEDAALKAQLARLLPEINFDGVAFTDVIDFLRDVSGANIFVDWKGLEAAGVAKTAPISARMKNVRLDKAIETILASAAGEGRLGFKVDRDVITISVAGDAKVPGGGGVVPAAAGEAAGRVAKREYEVKDLTGERGAGGRGAADREAAVLKMITGSVAPSSWKVNGGSGEARFDSGRLVITTTPENQKAIANLLEQVRTLVGAPATPAGKPSRGQ
jgi:RNA polymerase sigma factor (sigma-70 family)